MHTHRAAGLLARLVSPQEPLRAAMRVFDAGKMVYGEFVGFSVAAHVFLAGAPGPGVQAGCSFLHMNIHIYIYLRFILPPLVASRDPASSQDRKC